MASRDDLQLDLEEVLGSQNVYFQPPESKKIVYPCIIFNFNRINSKRASNAAYKMDNYYTATYITKKPALSTDIPQKMLKKFPMCRHDRHYIADNLHHDVFTLYY